MSYNIKDDVFSVYDYDEKTLQEVLCKFYSKIDEVIDLVNANDEMIDYLLGEGIPIEVAKQLMTMYEDGTIKDLINDLSGDLENQINNLRNELKTTYNGRDVKIIGCALRNEGNGFYVINDTQHNPLHITSVQQDGYDLIVNYDVGTSKVISLLACTDETLANEGYHVGCSVAPNKAIINFAKQDNVYGYITKQGGDTPTFTKTDNMSYGINRLTWDSGNNRLEILHDLCCNPIGNLLTRSNNYKAEFGAINSRGGFTTSYVQFKENISINAMVRYIGGTFTVDTGVGVNSVAWNDTNKTIRIEHRTVNNNTTQVTSRTVGVEYVSYVSGTSYVEYKVYKDGVQLTEPTTDINFMFSKNSNSDIKVVPVDDTVFCISYEGLWRVHTDFVVGEFKNIWLLGIMEV